MDKQKRLTRESEWIVGRLYRWKKGRVVNMAKLYRCMQVNLAVNSPGGNNKEGFVILDSGNGPVTYYSQQWRSRFILWA